MTPNGAKKGSGVAMFKVWDVDRGKMLDNEYLVYNNGDFYEDYRDFEDGIKLDNIIVMKEHPKKTDLKIFYADDWQEESGQ